MIYWKYHVTLFLTRGIYDVGKYQNERKEKIHITYDDGR
jgi:hypothetical protein